MSIYVDKLKNYSNKNWCHLWSDNVNELHLFANKIGLKSSWFQNKESFPHYDLVQSKRILAIKNGAIEISLKTWLKNEKKRNNTSR